MSTEMDEYQKEGVVMPYTFEDFDVDYILRYLPELPQERRREVLERMPSELRQEMIQSLPAEERLADLPVEQRLAGLSADQLRQYLERLTTAQPTKPRKPRRKK